MPGPRLTRKRPDERADMESAPTAWGSMLVIAPEAPGLPEANGSQMCGPCNAARQAKTLRAVWNILHTARSVIYYCRVQRSISCPFPSASTVRVSPAVWAPPMISFAIIVSTWDWMYRFKGRAP